MQIQDALGDWGSRPGPLYRRLAAALRDAVERGDLPAGELLPPERTLANQLAVGRSTVVSAYDRLRGEGVLDSRRGSGTWVAGAERRPPAATRAPDSLRTAALGHTSGLVDLATAAVPAASAVRQVLAGLAADPDLGLLDESGYLPAGLPALREAVAAHLGRQGLPTTADQVLITTGDQQALALICGHLLDAGDVAVVEDPTSPGILDVLHTLPVTVRTATSVSTGGADGVLAAVQRGRARLAYLISVLGPDGQVATAVTSRRLMERLAGRDVTVVDDRSQEPLCFTEAPPPLASYPGAGNVLTVGSMSKLFWGGLRVGWVRAPAPVIGRLGRAKARADLGTPLLSQLVSAHLLAMEPAVRRARRQELRGQLDHARTLVRDRLPMLTWEEPQGGLSLWLRLPSGTSAGLAEVSRRHGVAVVPGSLLSHAGAADDRVRVVYARRREVLTEGVNRLAAAWAAYSRMAAAGVDVTAAQPLLG